MIWLQSHLHQLLLCVLQMVLVKVIIRVLNDTLQEAIIIQEGRS